MRTDFVRVIARLVQVIVSLLKARRTRRQQAAKSPSLKQSNASKPLTKHQQRSVPGVGPNRRQRRQQEQQHAEEIFSLAMNTAPHLPPPPPIHPAETTVEPAPPVSPLSLEAQREPDIRQRTMPFKVADMAQFTLTAETAFEHKYNNVMLTVQGRVVKRLRPDTVGARHQKFVIKLADGQSLLIIHNIDDAPQVPFRLGDELEVRGRYVWNEQGGEMHWTHHDPQGKVMGGYIILLRTGQKYE